MYKLVRYIRRYPQLITLGDQALVSGTSFVLGVFLVKQLGLELYGDFTLLWLIVLFFGSLHESLIVAPMYTFMPKLELKQKHDYIKQLSLMHISFVFVTSVLLWLFIWVYGNQYLPGTLDIKVGIVLQLAVFTFLTVQFQRKLSYASGNSFEAAKLDLIVYGGQLLALGLIGILNSKIELFQVILMLVGLQGIGVLYRWKLWFGLKVDMPSFLEATYRHWLYSKWLLGTSILQWCSGNFFIIVAGGVLGSVAVGAIRMIQNLIGVLNVLFLAAENYTPIRASKILFDSGWKALKKFILRIVVVGTIATALIGCFFTFYGEWLLGFFFSKELMSYGNQFVGYSILYVLIYVGINLRFLLRTLEHTRPLFIAYILGAVFSLLFAKPILIQFGISGVVLGLIANQLIFQSYFFFSINHKVKNL